MLAVASQAPQTEKERLLARKEIKIKLAAIKAIEDKQRGITERLTALADREDAAVAEHQTKCAPLQKKLLAIDEAATEAIVSGQPLPEKLGSERAELLQAVVEANAKLEAEISAIKRVRSGLEHEKGSLQNQSNAAAELRGKLCGQAIGKAQHWSYQTFMGMNSEDALQAVLGPANQQAAKGIMQQSVSTMPADVKVKVELTDQDGAAIPHKSDVTKLNRAK